METTNNSQLMLEPGTMLQSGRYRIERFLAGGGFGNTYLAENVNMRKPVVIKEFFLKGIVGRDQADGKTVTITLDENKKLFQSQLKKFEREARRLFDLNHPNIVRVHDLFPENGTAYYVMDYVDGEALNTIVKRNGPLSENAVRHILNQMLDALEEVHARGIIHLDLKPGNIMINKEGTARLIDFGASKQILASEGLTTTTGLSYTPGYAAPEQVYGNIDKVGPWTDIYALGATLYNLLTAKKPPSMPDIINHGTAAFVYHSQVSHELENIIACLMHPTPEKRPQSAAAVRHMLTATAPAQNKPSALTKPQKNENTIVAAAASRPAKATVEPAANKKKTPWLVIGILLGVLALAGVLGGAFYFLKDNKQATENVEKPTAQKDTVATKPATRRDTVDSINDAHMQALDNVAESKAKAKETSHDAKKKESKKPSASQQKPASSLRAAKNNEAAKNNYERISGGNGSKEVGSQRNQGAAKPPHVLKPSNNTR